MNDSKRSAFPRLGLRDVVYKSPFHHVYKVRLDYGHRTKEMFITDYGKRVGIIVEGAQGILLTRQYRYLIDRIS